MADSSLHSTLSGALTSQTLSLPDASQQQQAQQHPQHPPGGEVVQPAQGVVTPPNPDAPVKRRPGRPKGSGKKQLENAGEPKVKRPVGRPRKDGLPAGSVGPKKTARPRKRAPGDFATAIASPGGIIPPYGAAPYGDAAQWQSISAPPMASLRPPPPPSIAFPIDPSLDRDNWAELARHRPDALLHALVTALSAPNPLSSAGISVEDAFKAHLNSLAPNKQEVQQNNIPTLYSILKTFWLPTSPSYFALTASAGTNRVPSEHRFLYWDPQPLVFNGIACPACAAPLINKGRISSGPIKVYDLGKPFFIIGCEYVCRSPICLPAGTQGEGRKFASTDISILRALPTKLKDEFPARLIQGPGNTPDLGPGADVWNWRGMGVSGALWDMARFGLRSGLQKEIILGFAHAIQNGIPDEPWFMQAGPQPPVPQSISAPRKTEQPQAGSSSDAVAGGAGADENEDDGMDEAEDEEETERELNKENAEEFSNEWESNRSNGEASGSGIQQSQQAQPEQPHQTQAQPPPQQAHVTPGHPPGPNDIHPTIPAAIPPEYVTTYPPHGQPHPQQGVYIQSYPYPPYAYYQQAPFPPPQPGMMKRTFALVESGADGSSEPLHKRVRHCVKCGSNECKGKGGRAFCTNPCQDCGKMDCKGRNSKRPDRTCADAWP